MDVTMNIKTKDKNIWIFPEQIKFDEVSIYVDKFNNGNNEKDMIFDLRDTINIHSSFIGFLIQSKYYLEKKNGSLVLLLSYTTERILSMLNILDYFSPQILTIEKKKSA